MAIINPLTGDRIWKTRISEGYAKHAAFSLDGKRFYIGEQSPDGFIYAYDLSTTKPTLLWKYRMADDIDTSIPHRIRTMCTHGCSIRDPIGSRQRTVEICFVVGNHAWTKDGVGLKKAQLYRFDGENRNAQMEMAPRSDAADDYQLV